MPRRSILTATERDNLLGWPDSQAELIRHYTLSATDLAIIRQHRGAANRLGYAVQLCSMRFPGIALGAKWKPFFPLLQIVATQLKVPVESWSEYGHRAKTPREHALELQAIFGFKPFTMRRQPAYLRRADRLAHRCSPRASRCSFEAHGQQQHNTARLAAPVTRKAKLAAHA